MLDIDIRETI